ncbi:hypothetical protein AB0E55_19635, partial [Amycolatopsis keratiniphila]
ANNGFLSPTGALGVDTGPVAGFDIYSDLTNGTTTPTERSPAACRLQVLGKGLSAQPLWLLVLLG